jgi:hypothetical protein
MKRITLVAICFLAVFMMGLNGKGFAQAILYEDFNYTPPTYVGGNGAAGSTSNNWTTHSVTAGQTTTIDVLSGSLSYTGLAASSGNMAYSFGNNNLTSRDINRAFTSSATALYFSALINVIDATDLPSANPDYFMHFGATSGASVTIFGGRLGIKSVNAAANYRLSIQNTSGGTPTYTEFALDLNFGTTYLIVVKYDRSASPTMANLWVNPASLGGTEPGGSVSNNSGTSTFATFASICIRNNATTPKVDIDEIRIGAAWADVTPTSGVTAPTIQASSITFSGISATGMTASWTNGNGAKRVVIMNTTNSFTNPVDGTDPAANTVYGGSGEQVVYNNSSNTVSVTGLTASTTYWFRVYEYNGSGSGTKYLTTTATGNPNSQATNGPPTVTTNAATAISSSGATLNGTVNANGYSTTATFDFGLTTGYGTSYTAAQSPITGNSSTGISYVIPSGLAPNTLYHYRAVGVNSQGTTNGLDMTFTTTAIVPTAVTTAATTVTGTTATMNGTVNANNASTVVTFDYGLTVAYGTTVTGIPSPVTGGTVSSVSYNLTGLTPNTLYHYRVCGSNIAGSYCGNDMTFTTSVIAPVAVTMSATGVGTTTATFNGTITANNSSSTVSFDYGLTIAYGTTVAGTPSPVNGMVPTAVLYNASGLAINTLYHFRVCATNSAGSSCGSDQTFTTGCPLPAPAGTITGSSNVCQGLCGYTYTVPVIANATGYVWTLPVGATITSGANTNSITVCYSGIAVSGIIQVYGTGVCGNGSPSSLVVTVNSLPTVTITGPSSVCAGSTGNVYTTQAGMSNYTWNVSGGGIATAGGTSTSNTVTVTWNTVGAQTVSVNYTNAGGCTAAAPTVYNVTVNARPVPTITGPATACAPSTGNVYTTQAGMSSYIWSVSAGGTITAGGTAGSYTMTVTWNTAGAQSVCVNYNNANGCNAVAPTCYTVTVNSRPVPTITGPANVCAGSFGNVYITEAGMSAYVWTVSAGGTITAGVGTNTLYVNWSGTGAQSVCVNYNNASGCNAVTPTCYTVNVNPLPVPTIAGPSSVCSGSTGNVYTTQAAMTNYIWTVSAGGQITAGGTTTSNTVTVKWNTAGAQTVSVNYSNAGNCTASAAVSYPVTVNQTPVPTITGTNNLCVNSGYYDYTTEAGMTGYLWTISSGGVINYGSGTNHVTVSWTTAGAQTISVNYTATGGCSAASPTVKSITVNGLPGPAGTITGIPSVCAGTSGFHYTVGTITNTTTYVWSLPAGATVISGNGTNDIVVSYSPSAVSGNITVLGNNLCGSGTVSPPYPVIVVPLPAPAGTVTGPMSVCEGDAALSYSVLPIPNALSYEWSVPAGAIIVAGANTNSILVDFPPSSVSGIINVFGTDFCGNGTVSPDFAVTVKPVPPAPVITNTLNTLQSSAAAGNQWYFNGTLIPGATGQTYVADQSGDYSCRVVLDGCSSEMSNVINVIITGTGNNPASGTIRIYPNPNDGRFVISFEGTNTQETAYNISVLNNLGVKIFELSAVKVKGDLTEDIDLRQAPNGVYTVILKNNNQNVVRKIIINK